MAFSTKIDLTSSKVYQGDNEPLVLSGDTTIAAVGTLKYAVHPTFTGSTQITDKQYVDNCVGAGVSGGTIYNLLSPAVCIVGGIGTGYVLTGKSTNCIIQDMLYPEICGTLTAPSTTSVILAPSTSPIEQGSVITSLSVTANFSRGSINPQGCSASAFRSGAANCYCFTGAQIGGLYTCTANSALQTVTNYTATTGANTWGSRTCYDAGVQPKSNKCCNFSAPLGAGITTLVDATITGILPYFYGVSTVVPTPGSALLVGAGKTIVDSSGQLNITYGVQTAKYLWFATPVASTTKLGWYEGATNKGNIGTGSDLFNAPSSVSVNSPSGLWNGQSYKFYVSTISTDTSANTYCMTNTAQQ